MRLEMYSDQVQSGVSIDDHYWSKFTVIGIDSQTFSFDLLTSQPTTTPIEKTAKETPVEEIIEDISIEEQMKLQRLLHIRLIFIHSLIKVGRRI